MSQTITVRVPDDLVDDLHRQAEAAGQSMDEYVSINLNRVLRKPDMNLRRHFGSISLGKPLFESNEEIDAALSKEFDNADQSVN